MAISNAHFLYYSDDPEQVALNEYDNRDGVLFDFDFTDAAISRFLYYHVNDTRAPRNFVLRLYNTTGDLAQLRYTKAFPGGSRDYMNVGHAATSTFLLGLLQNTTHTIDVAPQENVLLAAIATDPADLAVGMIEGELVQGTTLRCSLLACDDPAAMAQVAAAGASFAADGFNRRGRFDISQSPQYTLTYVVGQPVPPGVRVGERLWPNLEQRGNRPGEPMKGEYGIISSVTVAMSNPTAADAQIALYESAHGNDATGSYVVDGAMVESGVMTSAGMPKYKLRVYNLPAGATATSTVYVMPDAGSNLPIVLTVGTDDGSPDPDAAGSIVRTTFPTNA